MDFATLLGILSSVGFVSFAVFSKEGADIFWNPQGLFIVLGGSAGIVMIKFSFKQ